MRPFPKWMLWISSVLTGLTGIVYWWMDTQMEPVSEWAVINHPLQPFVLKAHIVAAPLLVFAVGLIGVDHIWRHFRGTVPRGRASGLSSMFVIAPMVLSGYLIQAITHAGWLAAMVWLHLVGGAVYIFALGVHQVAVKKRRLTLPVVSERAQRR